MWSSLTAQETFALAKEYPQDIPQTFSKSIIEGPAKFNSLAGSYLYLLQYQK
jgi:hypothetical protein